VMARNLQVDVVTRTSDAAEEVRGVLTPERMEVRKTDCILLKATLCLGFKRWNKEVRRAPCSLRMACRIARLGASLIMGEACELASSDSCAKVWWW